jgi:shikimate dehydrogenase
MDSRYVGDVDARFGSRASSAPEVLWMEIDGKTRLVGIVGHPLGHTISPAMHNAAFDHLGLDWAYVPVHIAPSDFHSTVEYLCRLGFVGFNVTMPYKEDVLVHLDEVASYAQIAGAVNTVQCVDGRLIGYNTDGRGFMALLEKDAGFDPKGERTVILGAGGVACAIVLSLALAGAKSIVIVNRTPERAERLAERVGQRFGACEISVVSPFEDLAGPTKGATLLVNATPVGMADSPGTPIDPKLMTKDMVVIDTIYEPEETDLLSSARAVGAKAFNGLGMLVYQAASALEIWTEQEAPVDLMHAAALDRVARTREADVQEVVG